MGWAQFKEAAIWCRDEAGAFLASFWMIVSLYAIGAWLLWVWARVDAEFSRPLAGGIIPSEVTQHFSWTILAFSVVVGMAASWCHYRDMHREKRIFVVLGSIAAIILLFHAWGLSAKIMEEQYARSAVISDVAETRTGTNDAQIAAIQSQIDTIERRTQTRVETLQRSIDNITNDRLDNDELADPYRISQQEAQDQADGQIAALQERMLLLLADSGDVTAGAQQESAETNAFNPLFTLAARATTGVWDPGKDPSFTHQYAWGFGFFFIFWGFGKLLMMTLFTLAFAMQQKAAAEARKARAARQGWQTRRANEAEAEKIETRRSRQSGKLIPDQKEQEKIARALMYARTRPSMTASGIVNTVWGKRMDLGTARELFARYMKAGYMTQEEANLILNKQAGFAVGEKPDPRAANGYDHTASEGDSNADEYASGQSDNRV